jgi:hypothetical protein
MIPHERERERDSPERADDIAEPPESNRCAAGMAVRFMSNRAGLVDGLFVCQTFGPSSMVLEIWTIEAAQIWP